jgi:L-ribulose-5-phosphate 4-epimerase
VTTSIFVTALVSGLKQMAEMKDIIRDTHGNLSVLAPGGVVCIKPSGMPYESICEEDIVCVAISDGEILMGKKKPSVDLPHHLAIYRRHPWINSICHTHSPYATAFAISGEDIECACTEHADYFGGPIICRGYRDLDSWGPALELDGDEKAVLLERHGTLTFGNTPKQAVNLAAALENVAQKTFLARNIRPRRETSMYDDEIQKWHRRYNTSYGQ